MGMLDKQQIVDGLQRLSVRRVKRQVSRLLVPAPVPADKASEATKEAIYMFLALGPGAIIGALASYGFPFSMRTGIFVGVTLSTYFFAWRYFMKTRRWQDI